MALEYDIKNFAVGDSLVIFDFSCFLRTFFSFLASVALLLSLNVQPEKREKKYQYFALYN